MSHSIDYRATTEHNPVYNYSRNLVDTLLKLMCYFSKLKMCHIWYHVSKINGEKQRQGTKYDPSSYTCVHSSFNSASSVHYTLL